MLLGATLAGWAALTGRDGPVYGLPLVLESFDGRGGLLRRPFHDW